MRQCSIRSVTSVGVRSSTRARIASPDLSSGTPKTAQSTTARCAGEHLLDLCGVDVDSTADHHVRSTVCEVEVSVVVEMADISERVAIASPRRIGLGRDPGDT